MKQPQNHRSFSWANGVLAVLLVFLLACCMAVVVFGTAPSVFPASEGLLPQNPYGSLSGKTLSVLGDSISACAGVSDSTDTNATFRINAPFFPLWDVTGADTMWWGVVCNSLGMKPLAINAYSGSKICLDINDQPGNSGMARAVQLGTDAGQSPDVIAVCMGTNDWKQGIPAGTAGEVELSAFALDGSDKVNTFAEGYAITLARIRAAYPRAQVWCCTPLHYSEDVQLAAYADAIRALATQFGCGLADFYAASGITPETLPTYSQDLLHPNAAGMQMLGQCFLSAVELPAEDSAASAIIASGKAVSVAASSPVATSAATNSPLATESSTVPTEVASPAVVSET